MPDIIEQLELGKKLQEEKGIDVDSLRTKIESTKEETIKTPNEQKEEEQKQETLKDPFEQAEEIIKDSKSQNDTLTDTLEKEKYPGFDFNNYYTKGQVIYYVKINNMTGDKELLELKIRSIYPKFMVACTEKAFAQCLGPDVYDYIFTDRYTAVECYNNTKIVQHVYVKDDLGDIEINTEE